MKKPYKRMRLKFGCLKNSILFFIGVFLVLGNTLKAQPNKGAVVIDQIAGVVGSHIVLKSEVETQYQQALQQGNTASDEIRCRVLDQLLLNKLVLTQAIIDSLQVTDEQVDQKIESNLSYYIQQIGSVEKLEAFYGKSIPEIKDEFRPLVRDQLLIQQMQGKLTKAATASPSDVKEFYDEIPKDSLPFINAEVEFAQIMRNVTIGQEEKNNAKEQLKVLRDRIINGEDFSTLSILYSQDKESAKQGGELGFVNRSDLVPEFAAAAFKLKNTTEVSDIIESQFGYHIIQLVERRGEKINVKHILITPKTLNADIVKTQAFMDSISDLLKADKIKFADAAAAYSDDIDTKMNGGAMMNPQTGSTSFDVGAVDPTILFQLDKMQVGEISSPSLITTREGKQAFRILYLKKRTAPHQLNLQDDYQKLQEIALNDKQQKAMENWRNKKKAITYIKIAPEYSSCDIVKDWIAQ